MWNKPHGVLCALVLGLSIGVLPSLGFAIDDAKEHEIKAAYIFNLGSYITWPDGLFKSASDTFTICLLGDNPTLLATLNFIAPKRQINSRNTAIKIISNTADGDTCQIVFIDRSMESSMEQVIAWHQNKPILLVSDMERFIRLGGMVEFYMLDNKVRLAMAPESITDTGLKPSSHLMRVAQLRSR